MKKQDKDFTDNEEFRDTDQGFNARNQNNESLDVNNKNEKGESSENNDNVKSSDENDASSHSFTDLEQDESGNLKSNN